MEEEGQSHQKCNTKMPPPLTTTTMESKDGNLFDFMSKKEDKNQEDVAMTEPNADGICDPITHEKDNSILLEEPEPQDPHGKNSSSSSDEEMEEGKESKKRKKKGITNKIKQKLSGDKCKKQSETAPHLQVENAEEEKKGFVDKIKEKLAGHHHTKTEGGGAVVSVQCVDENSPGGEPKEKKGFMDKIIGSLPGHHNNEHGQKEKEKEKEN